MAVRALARFAARSPVPVFGIAGPRARRRLEDLALHPGIELVLGPRHASVLLVAGSLPARHRRALARIHDQLPHPRGTLWWGSEPADPGEGCEVAEDSDPTRALRALDRELLTGERPSEAHWLPDEPPNPWRGRGDHGQGGEGMMEGVPYGRPMAMTDDDVRDGLALDRLPFTVGPFFPLWPPGLELEIALQGDVIQEAEVVSDPYPQARDEDPVQRSLRGLHRVLRAAGAPALAARALRLARDEEPTADDLASLRRRIRRAGIGTGLFPLEEPFAESDDLTPADRLRRLEETLPGMEWSRAVVAIAALEPGTTGAEAER